MVYLIVLMGTSLIGKALNFGLNEYGFESHVSKLMYNDHCNYLLNHINLNYAMKRLAFTVPFTKKTFQLCTLFKRLSVISTFFILTNKRDGKVSIKIHLFYFYGSPIHGFVRQISTKRKSYYVSYRALTLLNKRLGSSTYVLSTDLGYITHQEALLKRKGGCLLFFIYY